LAAKLGAEFVDQGHDLWVALVLSDVGGVLRHILECCHHLWVLENENALTIYRHVDITVSCDAQECHIQERLLWTFMNSIQYYMVASPNNPKYEQVIVINYIQIKKTNV